MNTVLIKSHGRRVKVLNAEGRPHVFITPAMTAKWPRLGTDGSLGSRFVKDNIKRAKQELICCADDVAACEFAGALKKIEKRALEALYANGAALQSTKKEHADFESFLKGAKRIVRESAGADSFRVSSPVVDYEGERVSLVRVEDDDGLDLRRGDSSPIAQDDRVVVRFHLEPYGNDEKRLYGCTCKLLSIVRKSAKHKMKKRKTRDYSFAIAVKKQRVPDAGSPERPRHPDDCQPTACIQTGAAMTNEEICAVQHGAETAFDQHGAGVCELLLAAGVRNEPGDSELYVPWADFRKEYIKLFAKTTQVDISRLFENQTSASNKGLKELVRMQGLRIQQNCKLSQCRRYGYKKTTLIFGYTFSETTNTVYLQNTNNTPGKPRASTLMALNGAVADLKEDNRVLRAELEAMKRKYESELEATKRELLATKEALLAQVDQDCNVLH